MKRRSRFAGGLALAALAAASGGCGGNAQENAAAEARMKRLENQLAQLEAAVVEAEDVSSVKRVMRSYGYYLEKGLWEDLAALFAENAVANYRSGVFIGRQSIRAHFIENLGDGRMGLGDGELSEHLVMQPVVHIAPGGKKAKGRWRALAMLGRYAESASWAEGIYEMDYVKMDGVWMIETLRYYGTFTSPYEDGGWGKKRDTAPAPRRLSHPPDKPSGTNECAPYPGTCVPPFHYDNPVSKRNAKDPS